MPDPRDEIFVSLSTVTVGHFASLLSPVILLFNIKGAKVVHITQGFQCFFTLKYFNE